jgi:hypothetical protein
LPFDAVRGRIYWERHFPPHFSKDDTAKIRFMQIEKMLAELRTERDQLDEAILTLQRLAAGRGRRRGRPPGSKNSPKDA